MPFHYIAFGLPIVSDIELPALMANNIFDKTLRPLTISLGKVEDALKAAPLEIKPFSSFNDTEFRYELPDIGKYYVGNGVNVVIEPLCDRWDEILLYFYANCLAAALYQRNIIPFHVSGVFVDPAKVLLFAAPSRTGKSTTALMLQEIGYAPFTDDTAILHIINGKCHAQASYPMARLWQNTIDIQTKYDDERKQPIFTELDKFGFSFHDQFYPAPVEVAGIVFLEQKGNIIVVDRLKPIQCMQFLAGNVYRRQWVTGMKKQAVQFEQLTRIAHIAPAWKAIRPKDTDTFESFAKAIEKQVIKGYGN